MEERGFHVDQEDLGQGIVALSPRGDVDIYSAPAFKQSLLEVLEADWRHVLIDLTTAAFIDSTGLGVLVSGAKKARRETLAVICSDESTRLIFDVVGFDRLFPVFATRADACAALRSKDTTGDTLRPV